MARNLFTANPVDLANEEVMSRARGAIAPQTPNAAEAKAPAPATPREFFDGLAGETKLPPNLIWAVAEDAAQDGTFDPEAVKAQTAKLQQLMAQGRDTTQALAMLTGDPKRADALLNRAYDIADEQYPTEEKQASDAARNDNYFATDAVNMGVGGAIEGTGMGLKIGSQIAGGSDPLYDDPQNAIEKLTNIVDLPARGISWLFEKAGDALMDDGKNVRENVSDTTKDALAGSEITGDMFKPSTWDFGDSPSIKGMTAMTIGVLGNLAPVVIAGITTGPAGAALVGAGQGGEGAAQNAREMLTQLAKTGELQANSTYYQDLVAAGVPEDQALKRTIRAAEKTSSMFAAPIAALGGAVTGKIASGGIGALAGRGIGTRVAGTAAISAAEEGTQEVAESVAGVSGINMATGLGLDPLENTFGDFIMGAMAGGPIGALGGIRGAGEADATDVQPAPAPAPEVAPPVADQGPIDPASAPAPLPPVAEGASVAPLPGPLEAAEALAPPPMAEPVEPMQRFPDMKPGLAVTLRDGDGRDIPVTFLREEDGQVIVRDRGQELALTDEEFDTAMIAGREEADKPAPKAEPTPEPEPAAGGLAERLTAALRPARPALPDSVDETRRLIDAGIMAGIPDAELVDLETHLSTLLADEREAAPEPDATDTGALDATWAEPLTKNNGDPFINEDAARLALKRRGLNPDEFSFDPKGAGVVATPKPQGETNASIPTPDPVLAPSPIPDRNRTDAGRDGAADVLPAPDAGGVVTDPTGAGEPPAAIVADAAETDQGPTVADTGVSEPNDGQPSASPALARDDAADVDADPAPTDGVTEGGVETDLDTPTAAPTFEDDENAPAPDPTDAQKEAGNYKMGHRRWNGRDISIETAKGQERSGTGPDGNRWAVTMPADYGYFKGTTGADGDHIDLYAGDVPESETVVVVNQVDVDSKAFDEHKIIIDTASVDDALRLYEAGFSDGKGKDRIGSYTEMTAADFKTWLEEGDHSKPTAPVQAAEDATIDDAAAIEPEEDPLSDPSEADTDPVSVPNAAPAVEKTAEGSVQDESAPDAPKSRRPRIDERMATTENDSLDLEKDLVAEVSKAGLSRRVSVRFVKALMDPEGRALDGQQAGNIISVSYDAADPVATINHEIVHVLRDQAVWDKPYGLFTREEWQSLVAAARADKKLMARIEAAYADLTPAQRIEEAVAELYGQWKSGKRTAATAGALRRIADVLRAIGRVFRSKGWKDAEQVMQAIGRGDIGGRGPDGPTDGGQPGLPKYARASSEAWKKQLVNVFIGKVNPSADLVAGSVGAVLRSVGVPRGQIFMAASKAMKVNRDHPAARTALMRLPDLLANPDAIVAQSRPDSDMRIYTKVGGQAVVIALKIEGRTQNGERGRVVMTVFDTERSSVDLKAAVATGNLLYVKDDATASNYELTGEAPLKGSINDLYNDGGRRKVVLLADVVKDAQPKSRRTELNVDAALKGAMSKKIGLPTGGQDWVKAMPAFASNALTDRMGTPGRINLLALVPGRPLFAELGKDIKAAQRYLILKEKMDSLRNDKQESTADVADAWMALNRTGKAENANLMDLMHRATLSGIDPTVEYQGHKDDAQARADHDKMQAEYQALPSEHREMFSKVATAYDTLATEFEEAVIENIKKSAQLAINRAEREHTKEIARIADEGLSGKARDDARAEADKKLAGVKARGGWSLKSRLNGLRAEFESNRLQGPYFPLARFGSYFVTLRDENGKVTSFSRFEKEAEQKAFLNTAEAKDGNAQFGVLTDQGALQKQVDPVFLADVQNLLGEHNSSPELMDSIWQKWLETLPDQSIRTSRIHRKGTKGYQQDALRAFSHHQFHGAHQLARLKFSVEMTDELEKAAEEAKEAKDPNRATMLVNEMMLRHQYTMQPMTAAWATKLTSLAFVWYLAATPAAAIVNVSQTTVLGPGIMGARFPKQGVKGAISELAKATKQFGQAKFNYATSDSLTGEEKAAVHAAERRGVIDKTRAHDLANVAENGIEYRPATQQVMQKISYLFHKAEVINRSVTFLAGYRMAASDGKTHEEAIEVGADLTWKVHYDYQNSSRPRFMTGDAARVVTTFRQYSVNLIFRLARDIHQTFNGDTQEVRDEARKQFISVTLSMLAHAGIKGVWGYAILKMALAFVIPSADDDDLERWLHDALVVDASDGSLGPAAWNYLMGAALNGVPGQLAGVDLTQRLGSPSLWFRENERNLEGEDLMEARIIEALGPVVGIAISAARGVQYATEGDYWRGTETAVPKAIRDVMKAARYAYEGVQSRKGNEIIADDNVDIGLIIKQAMGFTPAEVAERYATNGRMYNRNNAAEERRSGIQQRMAKHIIDGEPIPERLFDQMRAFNAEWPLAAITSDTLKSSVQSKIRADARNEFGASLNPRLNDKIRAEEAPLIYQ